METSIYIAIISASGSILVATLTYFFSKRKDREAERRKLKIEHYENFANAMSQFVMEKISTEARKKFADACNRIFLIASPEVVICLYTLVEEISPRNQKPDKQKHDKLLTELMIAMRKDIGLKNDGFNDSFRFLLLYIE